MARSHRHDPLRFKETGQERFGDRYQFSRDSVMKTIAGLQKCDQGTCVEQYFVPHYCP
ncbi:MAG: hypothetical protein KME16_13325 [Scytolyngbya sp. HA4215-MV1]|nr:hypothetical protein [Scytolyngbya sp. HA4215-MV1]